MIQYLCTLLDESSFRSYKFYKFDWSDNTLYLLRLAMWEYSVEKNAHAQNCERKILHSGKSFVTSNWNLNGTNTSRNCDSNWIFNVLTNLFEFKFTLFCSRNQTTWRVLYNGSDKTIRLIFSNIAPTSIAVIISGVSTFVWYSLT